MSQSATERALGKEINNLFDDSSRSGLISHAVALYGKLGERSPIFVSHYLPDGRDIFDLASMTKALVTTPLVFQSLKAKGLTLDTTVEDWLGEGLCGVLDPRLSALTVRSLLRHESGLPAWRNFWICHLGNRPEEELTQKDIVRKRVIEGLNRSANQIPNGICKQTYSDVGFILLGFCLSEINRRSISELFFDYLKTDLGLSKDQLELSFGVASSQKNRAVPTAYCALRLRDLCGEVHDENAASLGGVQGHAGLFGTAEAVGSYLYLLSRSPIGKRVFEANAKAIVMTPGDPPNESLIGWRQGADPSSYPFASGESMGHMGFTGVAFWVCPSAKDYAILLTNRVRGGRMRVGIGSLRREIFSAMARLRSH